MNSPRSDGFRGSRTCSSKIIYDHCVKQTSALVMISATGAAAAGFLVTQDVVIPLVIFLVGITVIGTQMVSGWWRRACVLTILAMGIGASHIGWAVQIGSVAKLAALGLLTLATLLTTRSIPQGWAGRTHKLTIATLWMVLGLAAASIIWSESRGETVAQVMAFLAFVYILHRTSTTRWRDRQIFAGDMGIVYWSAFALLFVGAVLAIVGFPDAVSAYSGRHQGIFSNPNRLGLISALTGALGIGWATHNRSPIIWISLLLPLSQVILSQSRTAIIATGIVFMWAIVRGRMKNILVLGYLALTIWVGAIAFSWRPLDGYFDRFFSMDGGDVLNNRTLAWNDVLSSVAAHPLGVGWAATPDTLEQWGREGITSGLTSVHNSYLQLIFELGWAGVLPVLLIIALLIRVSVGQQTGLGIGLRSVALTGLIVQITESAIFGLGQPYPYIFWLAVVGATIYPAVSRPKEEVEDTELQVSVSQK